MGRIGWTAAAVVVLVVPLSGAPARAEHAFLCEGGRIVYATDATLEQLKREDACVAGYYGAKPERSATADGATATPAPAPARVIRGGRPALELRPSSAREVVRQQRQSSRPRFHEAGELRAASRDGRPPEPLRIINRGASGAAGER